MKKTVGNAVTRFIYGTAGLMAEYEGISVTVGQPTREYVSTDYGVVMVRPSPEKPRAEMRARKKATRGAAAVGGFLQTFLAPKFALDKALLGYSYQESIAITAEKDHPGYATAGKVAGIIASSGIGAWANRVAKILGLGIPKTPPPSAMAASTVPAVESAAATEVTAATESLYDDVTQAGSRFSNRATDVNKADFEKNLIDSGWTRSVSDDGKVIILKKDGAKYVLRDNARSTRGPTADYYKPGSKDIDVKIRLGEIP